MIKMVMGDKNVIDIGDGYPGPHQLRRHPAAGIKQERDIIDPGGQGGALSVGIRLGPAGSK